jgi:hypothetical protein
MDFSFTQEQEELRAHAARRTMPSAATARPPPREAYEALAGRAGSA